jgi:hypothetical protein
VAEAGNTVPTSANTRSMRGIWDRARRWFVSSYPLLGGLASQFTIVADADVARRGQISIAAVHAGLGEIYINPLLILSERSGGSCWPTRCCTPRCATATASAAATRTCGTSRPTT